MCLLLLQVVLYQQTAAILFGYMICFQCKLWQYHRKRVFLFFSGDVVFRLSPNCIKMVKGVIARRQKLEILPKGSQKIGLVRQRDHFVSVLSGGSTLPKLFLTEALKLFSLTNNGDFTVAPGSPLLHSIILAVQLQFCIAFFGSPAELWSFIPSHCFPCAVSTTACGNVLWTGSMTQAKNGSRGKKKGIRASTFVGWQ